MTLYSSGKHEKLTADPWPIQAYWPDGGKGGRYAHPFTFQDVREFRREPRPEFDRPLTNPANPLLSVFREVFNDGDMNGWGMWLFLANEGMRDSGEATEDHYDHARKVLSRLARLAINE